MANLLDDCRRQGPSTGDITQKHGHLAGVLGAAVCQQKHGGSPGLFRSGKRTHLIGAIALAGEAQRAGRHFLNSVFRSVLRSILNSAECSRMKSLSAFTFSTGVSGRMPWPRL